jgi:hypothetical protein
MAATRSNQVSLITFQAAINECITAINIIKELILARHLDLIQEKNFIRQIIKIGENATILYKVRNPAFLLVSAEFPDPQYDQEKLNQAQKFLNDLCCRRDSLLHSYVYDHLMQKELIFEEAKEFFSKNINQLEASINVLASKVKVRHSKNLKTGNPRKTTDDKELKYNTTEYAIFSVMAIKELESILRLIGSRMQISMRDNAEDYNYIIMRGILGEQDEQEEQAQAQEAQEEQAQAQEAQPQEEQIREDYKSAITQCIENILVCFGDFTRSRTKKNQGLEFLKSLLSELNDVEKDFLNNAGKNRSHISHEFTTVSTEQEMVAYVQRAIRIGNKYFSKAIPQLKEKLKAKPEIEKAFSNNPSAAETKHENVSQHAETHQLPHYDDQQQYREYQQQQQQEPEEKEEVMTVFLSNIRPVLFEAWQNTGWFSNLKPQGWASQAALYLASFRHLVPPADLRLPAVLNILNYLSLNLQIQLWQELAQDQIYYNFCIALTQAESLWTWHQHQQLQPPQYLQQPQQQPPQQQPQPYPQQQQSPQYSQQQQQQPQPYSQQQQSPQYLQQQQQQPQPYPQQQQSPQYSQQQQQQPQPQPYPQQQQSPQYLQQQQQQQQQQQPQPYPQQQQSPQYSQQQQPQPHQQQPQFLGERGLFRQQQHRQHQHNFHPYSRPQGKGGGNASG